MKLSKIFFLTVLVFMSSAIYAQDLFKTDDIYAIKSVSLSDVSHDGGSLIFICLLYTSPSPRDGLLSRMPSSA